ncbi:thioredoxin-like domain-containing protein [Pedobacter nutrimenti]|uniref:thioredoxin-like domain-containing protein n=1 Tax=Pedobacter nutrimenti TaxID=1241337 RepID=UPI002931F2F4|nr:thioredoxin-like domain-containing protein [Pedobacter nutrimenti]
MKKLFFLLCMLMTYCLHAQNSKKTVIINFKINDSTIQGEDIRILYSKLNISMYSLDINYKDKYVIKCVGNQLRLEIKDAKPIGYLQFNIDGYRSNNIYNQQISSCVLLVEAGDELNLDLNQGKLSFTGKNAEKYNCQVEASLITPGYNCPSGTNICDCILKEINASEEMYNKQVNILNSFKSTITKSVYNQLKFNYRFKSKFYLIDDFYSGWLYSDSLSRHEYSSCFKKYIYQGDNSVNKQEVARSSKANHVKKDIPQIDDLVNEQMALNSSSYLDFCFAKEICSIYAQEEAIKFNRENSFYKLFNNIKSRYKGVLRDGIIVKSLDHCPGDSLHIYLTQALKVIKNPNYLVLLNEKKRKVKGMIVYNFSLPDTSGNRVNLSDLKGKVVLMDIWFTGCHGCAVLNHNLAPVYEAFKDNSKVVFLSACLDKSKEGWVGSMKSGIYTHPGSTNVYTNGQGESHELMKYYGFQGGPHMLLIDKNGKLWRGDEFKISKSDGKAYQEVIDEINSALNAK